MVLTDLPEGAAGEDGDTRFVEQAPGQFVGVDRELANVREGTEDAARAPAGDSGQRVETVDDEFATSGFQRCLAVSNRGSVEGSAAR